MFLNGNIQDLIRKLSDVNGKLSSLTSSINRNASNQSKSDKLLLEAMCEIMQSQQRIEESLMEQTEILKYGFGLPSKYSEVTKEQTSSRKSYNLKGTF